MHRLAARLLVSVDESNLDETALRKHVTLSRLTQTAAVLFGAGSRKELMAAQSVRLPERKKLLALFTEE